jgi:hypothetical protein
MRFNPFSPGSLVPNGVFTGRIEESKALERMLFHTKYGNPQHFLLQGERGIGKSSLMHIHQITASGEIPGWEEEKFNFLTVTVILEPTDTYESIVRKLGAGLRRELTNHRKVQHLLGVGWDFLKKWEVLGVKFKTDLQIAPSELLDELVDSYTRARSQTIELTDGILVMIDEADKPGPEANLGSLLKGFTERIARSQQNQISVGIAGVTGIVDVLRKSHESAPRIFTTFQLKPLSHAESIEVVQRGLKKANLRNEHDTNITEAAQSLIATFSEGYPHFIQQFAYCAFEVDSDWQIDDADVRTGAWDEHGAFEQLGTKYFSELYFDQIHSDDYRRVLRAMADHMDTWVSKDGLRKALPTMNASTLTNAIKALSTRRIIVAQPGQRGSYRLPLKSFAAWIRAYTSNM